VSFAEMIYEVNDEGLQVATSGPVVIDGVLHRVENRFVVCEPTLNRKAWNVTMFEKACPICYPNAKECASKPMQGELFDEFA